MTSLPFKPHIAGLPAYKPPSVPPGVEQVVDLSSNENPLGPSPKAMAALREASSRVNRYPDAGSTALKKALASKWEVSPANIALSNGADEWVLLLCLALVNPGDEVIMAHGSFISFLLRATEAGARLVAIPLKDYTHDLEAMAAAVTERTRLVFVCNPNNPTGTAVDAQALNTFLERVPERVPVVLDEAYYEYAAADPHYAHGLDHLRGERQNLIVLRSFSKVYGLAGLRVGYMLAHEQVIDYVERARPPFNVNRLAQAAALAALDDDEHVQRSLEANETAKAFFYRELAALGVRYIPSHANFLAIDAGRPGAEVSRALLERGFITTVLDAWGVPNHLRFSFGLPEENVAFVAALREVVTCAP
ncbi:MAG: histidinol-phosphate transaminase [Thermoflexales bacterium]|nr:histidinol-phosphate transaminase [Thermoflexales bacterium]